MKRPWTGPPMNWCEAPFICYHSAAILIQFNGEEIRTWSVQPISGSAHTLGLCSQMLHCDWASKDFRPSMTMYHLVGLGKAQTLWVLLNQSHDYLPLSVFAGIKWDAVKVVHKIVSIRHMFIVGFSLAMLLSLQDISSPARDWTWALGCEILESEPLDCKGIP